VADLVVRPSDLLEDRVTGDAIDCYGVEGHVSAHPIWWSNTAQCWRMYRGLQWGLAMAATRLHGRGKHGSYGRLKFTCSKLALILLLTLGLIFYSLLIITIIAIQG